MTSNLGHQTSSGSAWVGVLTAAALWGTNGVVFRALLTSSGASAVSIGFLRLALSVPFLLALARARTGAWLVALKPRDMAVLGGLGLAMAAYQLTYVLALERVGVTLSVLISICGSPIFVAVIAVAWLGDRLHARTVVALVMAILGTVLLVGFPTGGDPSNPRFLTGVLIAVACAMFQGLYVIAARASSKVCGPMHAAGIAFGIGALALLPIGLRDGLRLNYSPAGWSMLLYVAAVPTAMAQTLFLRGVQVTGAVGGAIASLLEPLVSTVLALVLLHEHMSCPEMLGAGLLLGGIVIPQWVPRPRGKVVAPTL